MRFSLLWLTPHVQAFQVAHLVLPFDRQARLSGVSVPQLKAKGLSGNNRARTD